MASAVQARSVRHVAPFSVRWTWCTLAPLYVAFAACAVPWLLAHSPQVGLALQRGFALVCHQQSERSFVLFGGSMAVCARCLGIYLGAAAGSLLRISRQVAERWLIVALALNFVDWSAEFAGLHGNWVLARFTLGFVLGVTGAMLVMASLYPRIACTNSVAPMTTNPA